jgi:hypothetical protein
MGNRVKHCIRTPAAAHVALALASREPGRTIAGSGISRFWLRCWSHGPERQALRAYRLGCLKSAFEVTAEHNITKCVVPAKAGAHNHRRLLRQKPSAICGRPPCRKSFSKA